MALAILLSMALTAARGLSYGVTAALALVAVLTFLALALLTKMAVREERLVYYHQQIAVLAVAAFLLRLLRQPLLAYLDVTILSVGLFTAGGRVGCLMVGCCHGRPSRWGVRYGRAHISAGFASYLVGVRLFPIQAVEWLWLVGIILVGSVLFASGRPFGEALGWYVASYGLGRFLIEFARGDAVRPFTGGLSEAQWTSLVLVGGTTAAAWAGYLPRSAWTLAPAPLLATALLVTLLLRRLRRTPYHQLLHPQHVRDIAEALEGLAHSGGTAGTPSDIPVARTRLGLRISASTIDARGDPLAHYALSTQPIPLTAGGARALARLIVDLRHPQGTAEIIPGAAGVYHVLVRPERCGED